MKSRCRYPNRSTGHYENVTYCDRWEKFENFFEDMGTRPDGTSLDRIDFNGNYEPNNCRWADAYTQQNNKSSNVKYYFDGEYLTLSQIARKRNLSRSNLANKIYLKKWDIYKAVSYLEGRRLP